MKKQLFLILTVLIIASFVLVACGGEETVDALANFKSARSLGLHPVTGLLLRMQDKLMRIKSFVNDGELKVAGESVDDACEDLVNYSILAKALLTEEREENGKNK